MTGPRFIVFDLDDTLYLERDFAWSGYRSVGLWAAREHGICGLEAACREVFAAGERRRVFNAALRHLGREADPDLIAEMIMRYRFHVPQIALCPDAARCLAGSSRPMGLISDGPAATQAAKVAALRLRPRLDPILLTGAMGPGAGKPAPDAFLEIERRTGFRGGELVYVADNLSKDFLAPNRLGWRTVRIARPARVHRGAAPTPEHAAEVTLTSLDALETVFSGQIPAA